MARAKVILVDSDVISHFIAAGHIYDLDKILSPSSSSDSRASIQRSNLSSLG